MRFFNTEGPVRPHKHYAVAPLDRVDVGELLGLIRAERYFVLHAPRQTGKTSALFALRDLLNSGEAGSFRCVDVNVEPAQVVRDDVASGIRSVLSELADSAMLLGDDFPAGAWRDVLAEMGPENGPQGAAHPRPEPARRGGVDAVGVHSLAAVADGWRETCALPRACVPA